MNADAFRHLYEYHFTINRKIWDQCVMSLTQEQFIAKSEYSVGSVRNQVVHMLNIDERWFCGLRKVEVPGFLNPVYYHKREIIREMWDKVEAEMRAYLANLRDADLQTQPFINAPPPYNGAEYLWQILFHVLNHGTDHRAQLLRPLNDLGVNTFPQDYMFFVMGRM